MSVTYCLDTNVLLRLQDEDKLDALATVVDCAIVLTDIVWDEATRKPVVGTAAKKVLLNIPHLTKHDLLPNADDTLQFDKLRTRYPLSTYHDGELSVIALAGRLRRALELEIVPYANLARRPDSRELIRGGSGGRARRWRSWPSW